LIIYQIIKDLEAFLDLRVLALNIFVDRLSSVVFRKTNNERQKRNHKAIFNHLLTSNQLFLHRMWTICKKEISQFFSTLTGYLSILLFLILNGIFLFVFSSFNIFDYGYASLENFFTLSPYVLLILIPATTMRLLTDEWRSGTMEILLTRPVSSRAIITGKYLASMLVIMLALLPTLIYPICLQYLAAEEHALDWGAIAGAYTGLLFLCSSFAAISLCVSSFTQNSIVAFLLSAISCFVFYKGFDALSTLSVFRGKGDFFVLQLGMEYHFRSLSRGVIDIRDLIYFISLSYFFIYITTNRITSRQKTGR
jgi:ABC-2 type transport system permease protein